MNECKLNPYCLGHHVAKVQPNVVVYVHFLPWYPVIDVFLHLKGGLFVNVFQGKWEIYRDYDFALWWFLGSFNGEDNF